jgi:hypothetical protein
MDSTHRPIDILLRGLQRYWFPALLLFFAVVCGRGRSFTQVQPLYEARALVVIGPRDLDTSEGPRQGTTEMVTTMASHRGERGGAEGCGRAGRGAAFPAAVDRPSLFLRARHSLYPDLEQPSVQVTDVDVVVRQVANRIKVRAQPLSNILTITYRTRTRPSQLVS